MLDDTIFRGKKWVPSIGKLRKSITETNCRKKKKKITLSVTLLFYLNESRQWENLENLLLKQIAKLLKKKNLSSLPDCAI